MKKLALIALLALMVAPAFADLPSVSLPVTLTVDAVLEFAFVGPEGATSFDFGSTTQGAKDLEVKNGTITWSCNTQYQVHVELTNELPAVTGQPKMFKLTDWVNDKDIGYDVNNGTGFFDVEITQRAVTLSDKAGDYSATVTASVVERT